MIWIVDDDSTIRDIEVYTLNTTGFGAKGFPGGEPMFEALKSETPELIVLDIMMPGDDGITILKKLRNSPSTRDIPIIMATAKGTEMDVITGLDTGADDYLVKPFGIMTLVSRIKAVLRRCKPKNAGSILRLRELLLNPDERTVTIGVENIALTYKEFELLKLFMRNPGKVFTRDMLFNEIWGADYVGETRTVDMHIRTLRKKLGEYGSIIETVRNVGYRMGVQNDR